METVQTVRIDNQARGEGVSGTAAVLTKDNGYLHVGYFTDNEVVVLIFGPGVEIDDIDPVSGSVGAMCVGTAYDVGLQLKSGNKEGTFFFDENASCVGSITGEVVEPDDYQVWDLSDGDDTEIDPRIIRELGL